MAPALPDGVVLGGTSARRDFVTVSPTYQFCDDRVASDGVAILLFSGPVAHSVAVGTRVQRSRIGVTRTVTRSEYGRVHEIDGRPALGFLARYLDVTGPTSYGNPLAVVEAGGRGLPPARSMPGSDPASGSSCRPDRSPSERPSS